MPFTRVGAGNTRTAAYRCPVGTNDAVTHPFQIQEVEAYRPEKRFGDAVKGLYVYGAGVVAPDYLYWADIRVADPAS